MSGQDRQRSCERVDERHVRAFSELFAPDRRRAVEIVVTFLALLELIRLNQVRALQPKMFDEIEIAGDRGAKIDIMPRVLIAGCGYLGPGSRGFVSRRWLGS